MVSAQNGCDDYWGLNLINPDKSASPLLEQLCLGIARLIVTLQPTTSDQLIPPKLATFYQLVGGNYDSLFLSTSSPAISLIYRSLGCFHSLQPTTNPFENPTVPALLPAGFVRWQTVQLLLDPDEHVPYLQQALKQFDIVNPSTGEIFPKHLPRRVFAARPDKAMTDWHDEVSRRLEQDQQNAKFQPFQPPLQSPRRGREHLPDYFANAAQPRRSSRPSRPSSREQMMPFPSDRRGSLPEQFPGAHGPIDPRQQHPMMSASMGDMRYQPGHRSSVLPERTSSNSRHRNSSSSTHRHSSATLRHRTSSSSTPRPDPPVFDMPQYKDQQHQRRHHPSASASSPGLRHHARGSRNFAAEHTPSSGSSGSDASSETSSPVQVAPKRRSSLFPPTSFFRTHSRRNSADTSANDEEEVKPPLPPRPLRIPSNKRFEYPSVPPSSYNNYPQANVPRSRDAFTNSSPMSAKPRDGLFDSVPWDTGAKSANEAPNSASYPPVPRFKYFDPRGQGVADPRTASVDETANGNAQSYGHSLRSHRKSSLPGRSPTQSGVGGRRYVPHNGSVSASPLSTSAPQNMNDGGGGSIPKHAWD